ncbi:hypothetical protein BpHYR1_047346 [Brachionus plicatilis]|uniref:Uncharacterized protein n=1 Tax=Brachionus plicatilis TaxID=10195 RepID=A0A3M7SQ27_BRAPC|nr:hypothetical protein BpHYR1_047346 [Brachionus plicatilis]
MDELTESIRNLNLNKGFVSLSHKKRPQLSFNVESTANQPKMGSTTGDASNRHVRLRTGIVYKRRPKYMLLDDRINNFELQSILAMRLFFPVFELELIRSIVTIILKELNK